MQCSKKQGQLLLSLRFSTLSHTSTAQICITFAAMATTHHAFKIMQTGTAFP